MSLFGRIGNDIAHPFGIGNGPVRTPAPQQQAQRQVIQTPAPGQQPQHFSQVAQQRIMARNPSMGAQQIARGPVMPNMNNMPHFNAFTAAPGAAFDSVKGLGNAFVNTAQVPYSAARVAGANITGNKKALQNAHKALASDTSNNIAWNDAYRQTANELAGAAYAPTYNKRITQSNNQAGATIAKAYGNTPRAKLYGSLVAEAGKNQDLNRYLNDVGLTQDTSRLATGLRLGTPIVSAGAQTALQATGIGAGGQIAKEAAAQAAGKMTAKQIAKQAESKLVKNALGYGAANAGISTLAPIAAGDTNAADYAKAVTIGALSGMALPVLGAGVGKLAGTKAGQEVANALTAKTNALKTLPKLPNPANALKKAANLPESVAHEHLNATDPYYAGYQDQINTLNQAHARNAANGMAPGHPTQVQLQKSMNQLGAKTADMRQAVLDNAKLNVSSKLGLKPLNSEGKALVKEDGSVIPTIRKAVGKPVKAPAEPTPVPKKIVSSEGSIAPQAKTYFRGGGQGSMPRGMTAKDVLKYETDELGNADVKPAPGIDLSKVKSENLQWVTGTKGAAKEYGSVSPVEVGNHRVVATDGQGGYLVEKLPGEKKFKDMLKQNKLQAASDIPKPFNAYKPKEMKLEDAPANDPTITQEPKTGTAPSTKPKPILPTAVVPTRKTLPKVSGEKPVGVSSPKTTPNNMSADSYARTFGVSKAQAAKDIAEASKAPKTKRIPKQKPAPATAAENTAKNPVKVNVPAVEAGNFEQARINPQLASHPVQFATGQLLSKAKRLGLDTSTFGKMVEGTIEPSTQAEADAVKAYRDLTDRVHATSQSLGGNTPYVYNYFRHEWDLSDPEKRVEFNKMAEKLKTKGKADNPFAFEGLDRQPRVFKTIAQGEALGFKLKNQNLADEIKDYGSGSAHALRQQALSKALTEADMNAETKPHTFDLGGGKNVLLSDEGMKQAKGYAKNMASDNVGVKAYRKSNRGFKQILLSVSQFHPINISVLRASPTLAAEGHGLRAAKGIFDTFAAQASPKYSEKLQAAALRDGTIEDSARMGTPIKFGSDYKTEGQIGFGKGGLGEKAIFERAMPAEHIQMVKAAKQDLQEKGLSLDSPEAHALGTRINEIMGFVNTEARNLDKGTQRRLGDIFLAPQFTRSKWATNKAAVSTGGLAGSYARSAVVANAAASAFVAMGVGYALHQKSDNLNDLLLRAVFHPSVPTPLKDKKGNTIEFGLPATQSSEVLGLLGFSLKRGTDQHLHVDWKGGNVPSNVANYGRSRLAVVPANALKVATNTDYAGKPLYDPNATAKTKLEQGATTVSTGLLPIGGQGIAQTKLVKSHLPSGVQQVLNANTPGTNPMLKSAAASFGLTPRTDKTVGKGQQTTQYFDALNGASKGLNSQEKAALTMVTGSKKNPVTGKYDVAPTSDDSRAKATALLQNPKVIDHLIAMNQTLKKQGQAVDPLFTASKDQITKYYQYQAMPPGSADKTDWMNKNKDWYRPVADARNSFFNSLPAGDPNKPKSPIQYPSASPAVANLQSQYDTLTDSKAKGNFIADHPELLAQWNKQSQYTNKMRTAQGYAALKDSPQAAPALQKYMDSYNAADKATRKSIRNSNPTAYQSMIAYYDSVDLYNLNKQGAVNQLQGEPDQNSKQNKAIQGLARDIYQNADGTYGIVPAGWMDGLSNGSGSSGGYGSGSKGGKKSKGLTAISNSKVSYAGLSKANRGSYGKFKVGGSSKVGSSTVKLASYKAPKANVIKKPKGVLA